MGIEEATEASRLFVISVLAETERKLCILTFGFVVLPFTLNKM